MSTSELFETIHLDIDSMDLQPRINSVVAGYREQTYLIANCNSVFWTEDTCIANIILKRKYSWVKLELGNLDPDYLNRIGYTSKNFKNSKFDFNKLNNLELKIIKYAENNGYPFASVQLDSISVHNSGICARINFKSGPLIINDSIRIIGTAKVKSKFLAQYLDFLPNKKFSQKSFSRITKRLKGIKFVKLKRDPTVNFYKGKAYLVLFIDNVQANRLNGILGILPSPNINKKVFINGELNLDIYNPFRGGKRIKADWQKTQPLSQQLSLLYDHPNLFSSGLNGSFGLELLKQDSTFINVQRKLKLNKQIGNENIGIISSLRTSRVLSNQEFDSLSIAPSFLDINNLSYGLEYELNNLDDPIIPKNGSLLQFNSLIGVKSIMRNANIHEVHYDNIDLKSTQIFITGNIEKYITLGKQSVLALKSSGGYLFNKNLFLNDMFRVGGLRSLRGFNENNFYASRYAILTTEYRLFTDNYSYISLFYDQSYLGIETDDTVNDFPFGIGAGISFATDNGVFNFVYSLGQSSTQKLSFNLSRIHFGLVSKF